MDSFQELATKLCEIICFCAKHSVEASVETIQALTQKVWNFIRGCVETCIKAVRNFIDCIFARLKAFYDNLSETLKDRMVEIKKKIDQICGFISQTVSKDKKFREASVAKLVLYLVKINKYVRSFFDVIGVASEVVKGKDKQLLNYKKKDLGQETEILALIRNLLKIMEGDPTNLRKFFSVSIQLALYLFSGNE